MTPHLTALAAAFLAAAALTPLARAFSHRVGYLDVPGPVSSHQIPVPKTGGYAIVGGILVALALTRALVDPGIVIMVGAIAVLALLAAVDELWALPRFGRFVVQIGVAAAVIYASGTMLREVALPFGVTVPFGALAGVITVVWIVGLINAYNFMDGLNGLASVEGIVCGFTMALLFTQAGDLAGAAAALAIAGACAGFLPWNLPSGSIFMGDVGSSSLGFLFALLTLRLVSRDVPFIAAALPLLPFLFDSSVTVVRRALRGERFFATRHRSHFYQRLNATGLTHAQVTLAYAGLAIAAGLAAVTDPLVTETGKALSLTAVVALHLALATWVGLRERRGRSSATSYGDIPIR